MKNETMPEQIYAWGSYDIPRWSSANVYEGTTEYVRADLVHGDPNEPLADGQWRWTKSNIDEAWTPRQINEWGGRMHVLFRDGGMLDPLTFEAIGPVIRPPEDV